MKPQRGDILVSNRSATLDHDVSFVPEPPHLTRENRTRAVGVASRLARDRQVDLWITENLRNFLLLECHRRAAQGMAPVDRAGADQSPAPVGR
jgi:hypothetical protein